MMKTKTLFLAFIVGGVVSVQACCSSPGDAGKVLLDSDTMLSAAVFGASGRPLNPIPSCIAKKLQEGKKSSVYVSAYSFWVNSGDCNMFYCRCDFCYGYSDHPNAPSYQDRFKYTFTVRPGYTNWYILECLDEQGAPELAPYLQCPPRALLKQAALACQDKEVLDEPPEVMEARLSHKFCAEPAQRVGRAFVEQMLASLDANLDGNVSCAEWGIASKTPTLEQLGGAYHGPRSVDPPACPMSQAGTDALAQYNAYLGELSAASSAAAQGRKKLSRKMHSIAGARGVSAPE